jgi:hypothetical protein
MGAAARLVALVAVVLAIGAAAGLTRMLDRGVGSTPRSMTGPSTPAEPVAEVPDVVGASVDRARDVLAEEGFATEVGSSVGQRPFDDGQRWIVCAQLPDAGEEWDTNSSVLLIAGYDRCD